MKTELENYNHDIERWEVSRSEPTDSFDEMAARWRPILASGVDQGEAWRLILWRGVEVERVEYLSRPEGF